MNNQRRLITILLCFLLPGIPALASGVHLMEDDEGYMSLVAPEGRPFTAKGVVYYQPQAAHHYFLRCLDTSRIPSDIQRYQTLGFNTLLIEVCWGELVASAKDGAALPNEANIAKLQSIANAARQAGVYLYIGVSTAIVPPEIPAKEYPAVKDSSGVEHPAFKGYLLHDWLVNPDANKAFLSFCRLMGKTLAAYPNIIGYAFAFENLEHLFPWAREDAGLKTVWQGFLKEKNTDPAYWSARHGQTFATMEDIPLPGHDWPTWKGYWESIKSAPIESKPEAWRDYYEFKFVAIGQQGRLGLSHTAIAGAIREGDPSALVIWKPYDPTRIAWEIGLMDAFRAKALPRDAQALLQTPFNYPGVDIIGVDAYPIASGDKDSRAAEINFGPIAARIASYHLVTRRPLYCQEYGANHVEWSFDECGRFLDNAIRYFRRQPILGYNLWQSDDYFPGTTDDTQASFGLFDTSGNPHPTASVVQRALAEAG